MQPTTPVDKATAVIAQCHRSLKAEAKALRKAAENKQPQPGSAFLEDVAIAESTANQPEQEALSWLLGWLVRSYASLFANVVDHLDALEIVYAAERPPFNVPMTLARVTVEAAARLDYLIGVGTSAETRRLRGIHMLLVQADHEYEGALNMRPDYHPRQMAIGRTQYILDEICSRASSAGFDIKKNKKGRLNGVRHKADTEWPDWKLGLGKFVAETFPEYPAAYAHSSGAVHSAGVLLDMSTTYDGHQMRFAPNALQLGSAALLAISASEKVATLYARYYGHEPASTVSRSEQRRAGIHRAMAELSANAGQRVPRQQRP